MKVAVLFSGGKDSVFAAFCCQQSGWDVILLTIKPAEYSKMFHHPNISWCERQANEMGLPIVTVRAEGDSEQDELLAIKNELHSLKVDGVASGAIESEYQKQRIDLIAHELGIRSFAPVWRTGKQLLAEMARHFETYVVAVSAEGLNELDLGARFDSKFLSKLSRLRVPVSAHLEGGEGETFVANAPFFRKRLRIGEMKKTFDGTRGTAEIATLE